MRKPRTLPLSLASAMAATLVASCSSDSSSGPEVEEFAACLDVSLAQTAGVPLDQVAIGRLPTDFEEPFAAWIVGPDGSEGGFTPISVDESGDAFLTVPFDPAGSLDGGSIRLAVSDGTLRCEPVDFTIQALPAADGELEAIAIELRARLESVSALLGTTTGDILATEAADLDPIHRSLAATLSVLAHPDNPYSLAAILDGSSPASDPVGLELANRLVARTSLRSELEAVPATAAVGDPTRIDTPGRIDDPAVECTPDYIGEEAMRLDDCMALQRDVEVELSSPSTEIADDLNSLIMLSQGIPFPPAQLLTRLSALVVYYFQQEDLQLAAALPSALGELNVAIPQTEWLEDELGPGSIETIEVGATSTEWSVGEAVLDAFLTVSTSLRLLDSFSDEEAVDDLGRYIFEEWLDEEGLEEYDIDAQTFGPVDLTSPTYSVIEAEGTSIDFESHTAFTLESPGTSTVRIQTPEGSFGGQQREQSEDITVGQISLTSAPQSALLATNQTASFQFTVFDAAVLEAVDLAGQPFQGRASIEMDAEQSEDLPENSATHTVTYVAPTEPNAELADTIRVRYVGTQGARSGDAPPREAIAIVRFGLIQITTPPRCVDIGEAPFQIEWAVPPEADQNPELVWTSSVEGTISQDGVFTPPNQAGEVTIAVALFDNNTVRDEITFTVGGCTCTATAILEGDTDETDVVRAFLSEDGTGIIGVGWSGMGVSGVTVTAGTGPLAAVIPFGQTGTYQATGQGVMNGRPWANPFLNDELPLAPLTLIIEENTGSVVSGSLSGMVGALSLAGPDPVAVPFSFTFYLQADPFYSDDDALRCIAGI